MESARVLEGQYTEDRSSQCPLSSVGPSTAVICPRCFVLRPLEAETPPAAGPSPSDIQTPEKAEESGCNIETTMTPGPKSCAERVSPCTGCCSGASARPVFEGLHLFENFLSAAEEQALMDYWDVAGQDTTRCFAGWKVSQVGRRKQEFGPQPNFKKKKVKLREGIDGIPREVRPFLHKVAHHLSSLPNAKEFIPAELSALEYTPEQNSALNPHIDDTWLWGNRVIGVSLLSDTWMTFVGADGTVADALLPRRSLFLLEGTARYRCLHGIRPEHITKRRVSVTVRELSDGFIEESTPETIAMIRAFFETDA